VLRFTTAVETACSHGLTVYPYRWKDATAAEFAASKGAVLADGQDGRPSLSPLSLAELGPGSNVVLPSPNGATCALVAAEYGVTVVAACLRNATAVARNLAAREGPIAVIACGEVWRPEGSIRPSFEDLLGAGAVLAAAYGVKSPEAAAAAAVYEDMRVMLPSALEASASGRELKQMGRGDDIAWCAATSVSVTVPMLTDGAFRAVS
jgi:2-phosphosulfolactate phosphatase